MSNPRQLTSFPPCRVPLRGSHSVKSKSRPRDHQSCHCKIAYGIAGLHTLHAKRVTSDTELSTLKDKFRRRSRADRRRAREALIGVTGKDN